MGPGASAGGESQAGDVGLRSARRLSRGPTAPSARTWARWLLVVVYLPFGLFHILSPNGFLPILPDWVPWPKATVVLTGVAEVLGAVGLLLPQPVRRAAGIGLALYAIGVFPANLHHALDGVTVPGLPSSWWYHAPRLAFQPVFVWWALWVGEVIDWPFRNRRAAVVIRA